MQCSQPELLTIHIIITVRLFSELFSKVISYAHKLSINYSTVVANIKRNLVLYFTHSNDVI